MFVSRGADGYIERQSGVFCKLKGFSRPEDPGHIAVFALSAVALKDHAITLLSGLATVFIVFHDWPPQLQYYGAGAAILLFIIYIANWFWQMMSLNLFEIIDAKVRAKAGHRSYTYAQLFTVQQVVFNLLLVILVGVGWYLNPL